MVKGVKHSMTDQLSSKCDCWKCKTGLYILYEKWTNFLKDDMNFMLFGYGSATICAIGIIILLVTGYE